MKPIRGFTRLLVPVPGEAFGSYVDRLAAWHKVNRVVMLYWLGLLEDEKYHRIPGFGIFLNRVSLERFSVASQLPRPVVAKMLLSVYDGISIDLSAVIFENSDSLRICTFLEWAYFSGSHACPHCLREEYGAWKLAWKLPWTFACLKHRCYLVSHCPACQTRLSKGQIGQISPLWVKHVPNPGHCINQRSGDRKGRTAMPCNYDLTTIPTITASSEALNLQRTLNKYLEGGAITILGNAVSPLDYFHNLRAMCALILRCADPKDFPYLPAPEAVALYACCNERNRTIAARKGLTAKRQDKRMKPYNTCPVIPELIAAIVRIAIPILAADAPQMSVLLHPITERCRTTSGANRWRFVKLGFSDPVAKLLAKNMEVNSTFDRAFGRSSVATREAQFSLQPQNIPALLWEDEFRRNFSIFFPTVQEDKARCFCSLALVKLCGNYTWRQSAGQLGLTVQEGKIPVYRCTVELQKTKARNAFGLALHELAKRLSDAPKKIDYAARREVLANLKFIPLERWAEICQASDISPGVFVSRRKNAAVWLWAELTGGDWRLSPGIADTKHTKAARNAYHQVRKTIIPAVAARLRAYGSELLPMDSMQVEAHLFQFLRYRCPV